MLEQPLRSGQPLFEECPLCVQFKDQLLGRFFFGRGGTEIKDTSISSKPDVDAFAQFFLNLSQHRARDLLPVLAVPPFLVRAGALP